MTAEPKIRRMGSSSSEVYRKLVQTAVAIIGNEGCQAITASRLAKELGLTRHIVHYYFGTIEDVFIGVIKHVHSVNMSFYQNVLKGVNPFIFILHECGLDAPSTFEYIAMSRRSVRINIELKKCAREYQDLFTCAIKDHIDERGIQSNVSANAIGLILVGIAQTLSGTAAIGLVDYHGEIIAIVESYVRTFEANGL